MILGPAGSGRALACAYAIFALAAGARSITQIATRFDSAPLAYLLSAAAAVVYVVLALTINRHARRDVAFGACLLELGGVLGIGGLSLLDPAAFPDETVWSGFGAGYLFVPLAMPLLGLAWLRRSASAPRPGADAANRGGRT